MYKYIFFSCFSFRNRSDCGFAYRVWFWCVLACCWRSFWCSCNLVARAVQAAIRDRLSRLFFLRCAATRADMYDLRGFSHHLISVASFRTKYIYFLWRECRSSASILRQCACRRFTICWQHRIPQHQHISYTKCAAHGFGSNVNTFCSRWYAIAIVIARARASPQTFEKYKKDSKEEDKMINTKLVCRGAFCFLCVRS